MIVRTRRGMGQASRTELSFPWSAAPSSGSADCAIGPPNGIVVIDAGDGSGNKIAAQLDGNGCVQSMEQLGAGGSVSTSTAIVQQVSAFVSQYKAPLIAFAVVLGVLAVSGGGGGRRR